MQAISLIGFLVSLSVVIGDKARFDNYRVYSVEIQNAEQLQVLLELEDVQNGLLFLIPPSVNQTNVEIVVPPHKFADISELCQKYTMENEIKIENLQR